MKKYSDDYSDINDREIPDPMEHDHRFGVMANSDGRRIEAKDNTDKRRNIRVF